LKLFGEGPKATLEIIEVLTFPKLGGFKRVIALVREVHAPHSQRLSLQRNARRVPRAVSVASVLHRVTVFVRHQRSLSPSNNLERRFLCHQLWNFMLFL